MKRLFALVFVQFLLTGCAASTAKYNPPNQRSIQNEVTVNEGFDEVWERLVEQLASDFFVINNIEKSSRIINVSFSSGNPARYVDCGNSYRTFKNARGENVYRYESANSSKYTTTTQDGIAYNMYRKTSLDGRANIYVAQDQWDVTKVRVNAKYVVSLRLRWSSLSGQSSGSEQYEWDFSTNRAYREGTEDGVVCVSKGNLERTILGYAKAE